MRIFSSVVFASLIIASQTAISGQYIYNPGSTATTGYTTLSQHLLSVTHNPAACSKVLKGKDRFRLAYLGNFGFYTELGQVDNFEDEIDELVDILDENTATLDQANELTQRFNAVLVELGESGYIKTSFDISLPAFPMAFRVDSIGGNICLEASANVQTRGSVLDDELDFRYDTTVDFFTESSLYLKSAVQKRFAVSYSRPLIKNYKKGWLSGDVIGGVKLTTYQMSLSKQVIPFDSFGDDDISDIISDEYDQNQVDSTSLGLDIGFLWDADRYQVGFTISNFIEPEFDYGTVGSNCDALSGTAQDNCSTAENFVNRGVINGQEVHTMHSVATVDASYAILPNWFVATSYDLVDYNDAVGDELQWFTLATAFMPQSRWIPGFRTGYRKNLSGEELSQLTFGTTLFGVFNFDLLYGLDDIEVDGDTYPRSFAVNLGFEQKL